MAGSISVVVRGGEQTNKEGPQGTFWVMEMFSILMVDSVIQVNKCKTYWNIRSLLFVNYSSMNLTLQKQLSMMSGHSGILLGILGQPPWEDHHRTKEKARVPTWAPFRSCLLPTPRTHEISSMIQIFSFSHPDIFIPTVSIRTLLIIDNSNPIWTRLDKKKGRWFICSCHWKEQEASATDMARSRAQVWSAG